MDLNSLKLNMVSICNLSRGFLRGHIEAMEVKAQMSDMIGMVDHIKMRLENVGMASDTLTNVTQLFNQKMDVVMEAMRKMSQSSMDQLSAANKASLQVMYKLVNMAEEQKQSVVYYDEKGTADEDLASISSSSIDLDLIEDREMDIFGSVPEAAMQLMMELTNRGGDTQSRSGLLEQITSIWSEWRLQKSDIKFDEDEDGDKIQLGRGATGDVFAGFLRAKDGSLYPVAVKSVLMNTANIPDMLREVFLHLLAHHSTIVTLHGMFYPLPKPGKNLKNALIVVERMFCSVAEAIEQNMAFDRKLVLHDIASAVTHLHEKGIVHRDLKPDNMLLNDDLSRAKLSDFGSSRRRSNKTITATTVRAGTPLYMAPEVVHNVTCKTSLAWDVWSFGIVMCELLNTAGREGYVSRQHSDMCDAAIDWSNRIDDDHLRHLARWCLRAEPRERPTMKLVSFHLDGVLNITDIPAIENECGSPSVSDVIASPASASASLLPITRPRTAAMATTPVRLHSNVVHATEHRALAISNTSPPELPGVDGDAMVTPMPIGSSDDHVKTQEIEAEEQGQTSTARRQGIGGVGGTDERSAGVAVTLSKPIAAARQPGESAGSAHMAAGLGAEGQVIEKAGWGAFRKVKNGSRSKTGDVLVQNRSGEPMGVYKVVRGGCLQKVLEVDGGKERAVLKTGWDGGVTMVLKEERSQLVRAVFGVKDDFRKEIKIAEDSVTFRGRFDRNTSLKKHTQWPVTSVWSGRPVELTIIIWGEVYHNLSVNKVDDQGREERFIERIGFESEDWTGRVDARSFLVFRISQYGEDFLYAVCVPDVAHFTLKLDGFAVPHVPRIGMDLITGRTEGGP